MPQIFDRERTDSLTYVAKPNANERGCDQNGRGRQTFRSRFVHNAVSQNRQEGHEIEVTGTASAIISDSIVEKLSRCSPPFCSRP